MTLADDLGQNGRCKPFACAGYSLDSCSKRFFTSPAFDVLSRCNFSRGLNTRSFAASELFLDDELGVVNADARMTDGGEVAKMVDKKP